MHNTVLSPNYTRMDTVLSCVSACTGKGLVVLETACRSLLDLRPYSMVTRAQFVGEWKLPPKIRGRALTKSRNNTLRKLLAAISAKAMHTQAEVLERADGILCVAVYLAPRRMVHKGGGVVGATEGWKMINSWAYHTAAVTMPPETRDLRPFADRWYAHARRRLATQFPEVADEMSELGIWTWIKLGAIRERVKGTGRMELVD